MATTDINKSSAEKGLLSFLLIVASWNLAGTLICLVKFPSGDISLDPSDYLSCWRSFLLLVIVHVLSSIAHVKSLDRLVSATIPLNLVHTAFMVVDADQTKGFEGNQYLEMALQWLALFLFIAPGAAVFLYTGYLFFIEGEGTPSPAPKALKTRYLVVKGPYAYVRNPMVLGGGWALLGVSLAFGSMRLLVWDVVSWFCIIAPAMFVVYEEPDLQLRFGEEYIEYCRNVPRLIPRLTPYMPTKRSE